MEHCGFHKDKELYEFLGVKSTTFSSWRTRNTLDYELIMRKFPDVDYNWLFKEGQINTHNLDLSDYNEQKAELKQCRDQLSQALDIIATLSRKVKDN